jgi:hypothetical protein
MLGRRWAILAGLVLATGTLASTAPAVASAATVPATHVSASGPMIRVSSHGLPRNQAESSNWSGYAANGGTYTSVSANWTEPAGHCGSGATYAAFWVGLDGYSSSTVEQTGTDTDCSGGSPQYYGWYEMYPNYPVNFANPMAPGDSISGSVTYNGGSSYTLVLTDHSQGWTQTVHASLSGAANSSAEVITEAPCCTGAGNPLPLTNFGTVNYSGATVDGQAIGNFGPTSIIMVDGSGRQKDSTSSLSGGTSFSNTWIRKS